MNWKFYCESTSEIPLPPKFKFPQALNYLNPEKNSFYILENEFGYIQCAGEKKKCIVEMRVLGTNENDFHYYIFYREDGSEKESEIQMSHGVVLRKKKHCFGFLSVADLFKCFYESKPWPEGILLEEISHEFK